MDSLNKLRYTYDQKKLKELTDEANKIAKMPAEEAKDSLNRLRYTTEAQQQQHQQELQQRKSIFGDLFANTRRVSMDSGMADSPPRRDSTSSENDFDNKVFNEYNLLNLLRRGSGP